MITVTNTLYDNGNDLVDGRTENFVDYSVLDGEIACCFFFFIRRLGQSSYNLQRR